MGLSHRDFTIAWITTSRKDFTAAQQVLDDASHDLELPKEDLNTYFYGRVGTHNILVMCLETRPIGIISASKAADGMLSSFPLIRVVLIVGTASGVPTLEDVRLGDVVIGEQLIPFHDQYGDYDSPRPSEPRSQPLLNAVQAISVQYDEELNLHQMVQEAFTKTQKIKDSYQQPQNRPDRLCRSEYTHRPTCDCLAAEPDQGILVTRPQRRDYESIKVHFGKIALSEAEVEDTHRRDAIANIHRAICLIPTDHVVNKLPCLQIRGIRDYSDSHKSDAWHGYAAAAAAVYTTRLVEQITPEQILRAHTAVESTAVRNFFAFVTGEVTHAVNLLPQSEAESKLKAASRAFRSVQAGLDLLYKLFEESHNDIKRLQASAADTQLHAHVQVRMQCIFEGQDRVRESLASLGRHAGKPGGARASREERAKWQELQKNAQESMAYLQKLSDATKPHRKTFGNGGVKRGHVRGLSRPGLGHIFNRSRESLPDSVGGHGYQEPDAVDAGGPYLRIPTGENSGSVKGITTEPPPDTVKEVKQVPPPTASVEKIVVVPEPIGNPHPPGPTGGQPGRSNGNPMSPPRKPPHLQSPSTTSMQHDVKSNDPGQGQAEGTPCPPGLSPPLTGNSVADEEKQNNEPEVISVCPPQHPDREPPTPPPMPVPSNKDEEGVHNMTVFMRNLDGLYQDHLGQRVRS